MNGPLLTWEAHRSLLLALHGACALGSLACVAGFWRFSAPGRKQACASLLWLFLLGCAVTGGMLYPAFETRALWEKLGYTGGWGERFFRVKTHLAVTALAVSLLFPRLHRAARTGQARSTAAQAIAIAASALVALTLLVGVTAIALVRHGGHHP